MGTTVATNTWRQMRRSKESERIENYGNKFVDYIRFGKWILDYWHWRDFGWWTVRGGYRFTGTVE